MINYGDELSDFDTEWYLLGFCGVCKHGAEVCNLQG